MSTRFITYSQSLVFSLLFVVKKPAKHLQISDSTDSHLFFVILPKHILHVRIVNELVLLLGVTGQNQEFYLIVLYCIVLSCLVLSCLVLSCLVLSCLVLYCIVLYCIVLYCIVLYCIVLYCIVLYCIVFYYPTALRRVQITLKTSTNITRYLYSRGPVRQVSCR